MIRYNACDCGMVWRLTSRRGSWAPTICGLAAAFSYAVLAWASHAWGRPPLAIFFCCMACAGAAMLGMFRFAAPGNRGGYRQVLLWALLFRAIGFAGRPLYEDDFYRYLWDGRQFVETGSPYEHAPAELPPDSAGPLFSTILRQISYPQIPTIYGPVCQYAFAAAYLIGPGRVWALKLIFCGADLLVCLFLIRLGVPPGQLALYAWSPLVVKEIAFTAHTDSLAAMFSVASLYIAQRGRAVISGLALAAAGAAKLPSLLIVPAIAARGRLRSLYGLGAGFLLLYLPFWRRATDARGLTAYLQNWEFNSLGYAVLQHGIHLPGAKSFGFAIVIAVLLMLWWRCWRAAPAEFPGSVAWGVFCLFAPVVNPWYLVAWVPWTALAPDDWAIAACLTPLLSYATGANLPASGLTGYNHPWWIRPAEVLPVLWLLYWRRRRATVPERARVLAPRVTSI